MRFSADRAPRRKRPDSGDPFKDFLSWGFRVKMEFSVDRVPRHKRPDSGDPFKDFCVGGM